MGVDEYSCKQACQVERSQYEQGAQAAPFPNAGSLPLRCSVHLCVCVHVTRVEVSEGVVRVTVWVHGFVIARARTRMWREWVRVERESKKTEIQQLEGEPTTKG